MDYSTYIGIKRRLSHEAETSSHAKQARSVLQIGDPVPDFQVQSTQGSLNFHDWAQGSWVFLFSLYRAFSPVCTTELASFAVCTPDFQRRGTKMLGISGSTAIEQLQWHEDVRDIYGVDVSYPVVADSTGQLPDLFGMIRQEQSTGCPIRKSLILGPDLKVRMILEYPVLVGRSTEETLRVIDALQTAEAHNVGTWADWQKGEDILLLPGQFGEPRFDWGTVERTVRPYLRTAPCPSNLPSAPGAASNS